MDLGEDFLHINLSLRVGVYDFFFLFVCGKLIVLLLLVVTGNASCDSSLYDKGRIKSHIPCNSTISSSLICSSTADTSSSSTSDSVFDIVFGGLGLEEGFLL